MTRNIWIFQANPKKFNILKALLDRAVNSWRVKQYPKNIKKGDIAIIWICGKKAGIYALVEITSDPKVTEIPVSSEKYWHDQKLKENSKLRVDVKTIKNLVYNPVLKIQLKRIPELKELSILKYFQKTNFPVKKFEWEIIKKLI